MSSAAYPWNGGKSVFEHIQDLIETGKMRYADRNPLPDDDDDAELKFAAGGLDGIHCFHMLKSTNSDEIANAIGSQLLHQAAVPCDERRQALYRAMTEPQAITYVDELCEYLGSQLDETNANAIFDECMWLVWNASHREPLKVAIAILGLFGDPKLCRLFRAIGQHDEFTLFAVIALLNSSEDKEKDLIELSNFLSGWGKIQAVRRLTGENERVRKWLVQEGCSNGIMNNYLALHCAMEGNLAEVVSRRSINDKTYFGVQIIILGLLDFDGPWADIDDYEAAPQVIRQFMRHAENNARSWEDFFAIVEIRDFLQQSGDAWQRRFEQGWTTKHREESSQICDKILQDRCWPEKIKRDLYYDYVRAPAMSQCYRAGKILGIDLWDRLFRRLVETPEENSLLMNAVATDDPAQLQKIADFLVGSSLMARFLSTKPADAVWFPLAIVLQNLAQHVGCGFDFVWTVLTQASEERTRGRAVMMLERWAEQGLDQNLRQLIRDRLYEIIDQDVREKMLRLINEAGGGSE